VATRADLNQVEFENITKALSWTQRQAHSLERKVSSTGSCWRSTVVCSRRLDVGRNTRWRVTNIGVEPHLIATQSRLLLDDASLDARVS